MKRTIDMNDDYRVLVVGGVMLYRSVGGFNITVQDNTDFRFPGHPWAKMPDWDLEQIFVAMEQEGLTGQAIGALCLLNMLDDRYTWSVECSTERFVLRFSGDEIVDFRVPSLPGTANILSAVSVLAKKLERLGIDLSGGVRAIGFKPVCIMDGRLLAEIKDKDYE